MKPALSIEFLHMIEPLVFDPAEAESLAQDLVPVRGLNVQLLAWVPFSLTPTTNLVLPRRFGC